MYYPCGYTFFDIRESSSEESGWRESIVSKVYKALNDQSSLGRSTGALSIRAAYRLIDGSYVMATAPIICQHTIDTWSTDRFFRYSLTSDANPGINNQISFLTCKYTISLYKYDYRSLFASKKLSMQLCSLPLNLSLSMILKR